MSGVHWVCVEAISTHASCHIAQRCGHEETRSSKRNSLFGISFLAKLYHIISWWALEWVNHEQIITIRLTRKYWAITYSVCFVLRGFVHNIFSSLLEDQHHQLCVMGIMWNVFWPSWKFSDTYKAFHHTHCPPTNPGLDSNNMVISGQPSQPPLASPCPAGVGFESR